MKLRKAKAIMHFNKPGSKRGLSWTPHHRGTCYVVKEIHCNVPMVSEYKPNKASNPRAFFTAMISDIKIKNKIATLS